MSDNQSVSTTEVAPAPPLCPIPANEEERLAALRSFQILDTLGESAYDDLTVLATTICEAPIALVSLVDEDRQWFKSKVGLEVDETPRDLAFCAHTILGSEPMVVPDASQDPRFQNNPLVTGEPHIRLYAGAPITTNDGLNLGTLCVIDQKPRTLEARQIEALKALARQAFSQLELRLSIQGLQQARERERQLKELAELQSARLARNNEALNEFTHVASHDLKSPLRNIRMLAEWIESDSGESLSKESRRHLELLRDRAENLGNLIDDLLTYCRAGNVQDMLQSVNTRELIEEVVGILAPPTDCEIRIEGEALRLETPKAALAQCLRNLLDNALKHAKDSDGPIVISVEGHGEWIRFSVKDHGPGIRPEDQQRIFGMFKTLQGESSGSGLGLAVVKKTIEAFGGDLELESAPGQGSTFHFTWPREIREQVLIIS